MTQLNSSQNRNLYRQMLYYVYLTILTIVSLKIWPCDTYHYVCSTKKTCPRDFIKNMTRVLSTTFIFWSKRFREQLKISNKCPHRQYMLTISFSYNTFHWPLNCNVYFHIMCICFSLWMQHFHSLINIVLFAL